MLPKGLILQQSAEHLVKAANSTHASPYQVYFAKLGRLVVSVESRALESLPKLLKEWKIWLKKKCKRMMKLQLLNLATFFTWMELRSHIPPFFAVEGNLVGHSVALHTANWSERLIKRKDWPGAKRTSMQTFLMWYGQMRQLYSWKTTVDSVTESVDKNHDLNQG